MIIHKLIARHWRCRDDDGFYRLQAEDAIAWLERQGVQIGPGLVVLDLGCGHGLFGEALRVRGCTVTFADEQNFLRPRVSGVFRRIDLNAEDPVPCRYDLVICSNVLEHLRDSGGFLNRLPQWVEPGGLFYLSWTNWLSPWGGHEFSPFHYLGPKWGPRLHDLFRPPRLHTPGVNLFPTWIGRVLRQVRGQRGMQLIAAAPRYYPEFAWILRWPVLREFLTWNCALLLQKDF